ncbi:MAG TPA: uracil-DNA glycosylase family protein [Gaiellaceae bacterium]
MPTDELSERYLRKAIAEMNELGHEIAQAAGADRAPVLGSGHPLADVFLLKHTPRDSEIQEGVAFYGRAGAAIMKALSRLRVDQTAIYGTNVLKFESEDEEEARGWLLRELHVVQPKIVVVMGQDALSCLNETSFPLSAQIEAKTGEIQSFTPTTEALVTPDVDDSLDEQPAKRAFWEAFKELGPWWAELPPW